MKLLNQPTREIPTRMLWGRHPRYANGAWIKLARDPGKHEIAERARQGFDLSVQPFGEHPEGAAHGNGGAS